MISSASANPQVVCPGEVIARGSKNSLHRLLRSLLGVEAYDGVRDIGIRHELPDGVDVLLSLAQQQQRLFQLRPGQECGPRGALGARACSEQTTAVRPPPQRQRQRQRGQPTAGAHRAGAPSRSACYPDAPRSRGSLGRCPHAHPRAPASQRARLVTCDNGGGEIRTLGTPIRRTTVFETAAFNRSATPPG